MAAAMGEWRTVGEQRHIVREWRRDGENKPYAHTRCGQLIWPSRHDARIVDPRMCQSCALLAGVRIECGCESPRVRVGDD